MEWEWEWEWSGVVYSIYIAHNREKEPRKPSNVLSCNYTRIVNDVIIGAVMAGWVFGGVDDDDDVDGGGRRGIDEGEGEMARAEGAEGAEIWVCEGRDWGLDRWGRWKGFERV